EAAKVRQREPAEGITTMPKEPIVRLPTAVEAERLRRLLRAAHYDDTAVCERLGISSIVAAEPLHIPYYLHQRIADADPQSALIRLFLLQRPVATAELLPALGANDVSLLAELGLVKPDDGMISPGVDLYPYDGRWFVTDRSDAAGEGG